MCAELLEIARAYAAAGLSVIPVRADGSKAPALPAWKEHQQRRADEAELILWFGHGQQFGVAIVCGAISQNLEVMDFDEAQTWERWRHLVELERPGLLRGIPCVKTPGGGRHLYLFGNCGPNRKLARTREGKTLIEIRGEGGYVLAPGCSPACHPTRRLYTWERPLAEAVSCTTI